MPNDDDYPITDPIALGRRVAEENLFNAIDDLSDGARDALNDFFDTTFPDKVRQWMDMTEDEKKFWTETLDAYRAHMTEMLNQIQITGLDT